jgi:glycolate oxidase
MKALDPAGLGLRAVTVEDARELAARLGADAVIADAGQLERFGRDETEALFFPPALALLPRDVTAVESALAYAHEARIPVVARGAGTGLSGGALPVAGGVVLSLERLNRIREIDTRDLVAVAEAGVTTAALQEAVERHGLFYPPDPASRESCTLGGNLAEDSAGPRSVKYGTTRRWVLGLEAVLADGRKIETGSRVRKDATGYALAQLLVGSEGTLAVITAATLRLIAKPEATLTLVVPFRELGVAAAAVEGIFAAGFSPSACELMERAALAAVGRVEALPRELEGAEAMLLVELDGGSSEALLDEASRLDELTRALGGGDAIVADDVAGQRRLWQIRRRIGEAVKHLSEYKEADTVVPRSKLVEVVEAARAAAARHGLTAICYGHAGDGNLHVNLLRGELPRELWESRRDAAEEELFRATIALGGRVTGEHGVGWTQRRFLPLALSIAEIEAQRALKRALDPRGILNPGKIFPDFDSIAANGETR